MKIQLAPTAVKYETEIPLLFSTAATACSEAKVLLARLSSHVDYTRNEHLHDFILSSHDNLVIDHCRDESSFNHMNLLLLKMALVMPAIPNVSGKTINLDVQYGTALVHFYPDF